MNTRENSMQILDTTASTNPQLTEMPEKEQGANPWSWVRSHKKQIVLAVIGITATLGVIYGTRNKKATVELLASHEEAAKQVSQNIAESIPAVQASTIASELVEPTRPYTKPTEPVNVTCHIRDMAEWKHYSAAKAAQAAAMGIDLKPNQTIVDSYSKYAA